VKCALESSLRRNKHRFPMLILTSNEKFVLL